MTLSTLLTAPLDWVHHHIMVPRRQRAAFRQEFDTFQQLDAASAHPGRFALDKKNWYPCLEDKTTDTGFDRHYVYHTAWAARIVQRIQPEVHVDISSSLYFCSLVSAFVPVRFYDYRPPLLSLPNLTCERGDLMALPFDTDSVESLSCMHVVEHVGLGRYGDPMDPEGDLKAIAELSRVIRPGGSLLFVVPLAGKPHVAFNAHRVYSKGQVLAAFPGFNVEEFALIPASAQQGGLIVSPSDAQLQAESYACGCFWLRKKG
ncbi:TPA: hypothetical protein DDW35_02495 [Candidatus Sumerlaeota bacterium]|jgi:SAM-dependent methyltransferase|nr:hypothetical protein [Candidatus Sumerlaeota bacterium]